MMYHKQVQQDWVEENLLPFDELIFSWNGERPKNGSVHFYIRVKIEGKWTPELLYATWGSEGQRSYEARGEFVRIFQDTLEVVDQKKADGFQIRIKERTGCAGSATPAGYTGKKEGSENAFFPAYPAGVADPAYPIFSLHVYTNADVSKTIPAPTTPIRFDVQGLSQRRLNHPRYLDLCSPTSTAIVTQYLSKRALDPVEFATHVWDQGFDIFGNWVLSVAEASNQLGRNWHCWVERLSCFNALYQHLQNAPVIVSVRGPLPGSALPYANGHLMVVIGYDPDLKKVHCIDPAFPKDEQTHVFYELDGFIESWNRRGRIAYVFKPIDRG